MQKVPCIYADDLTDEQVKAYRLADNKTNELAEWDFAKLNEELSMLNNFDMDLFGFSDLPAITETSESEDFDIEKIIDEVEEKQICKKHNVWKLGRHRLICGDCTDENIISKLMNGKKADLLLTDPPYNVAIENSKGLKIKNDDMKENEFLKFLESSFSVADKVMKDGAVFYIWHGESEGFNFRKACKSIGWDIKQCLIWVKNSFVLGRQDYQWKHEPCLYGWKSGAKHYFFKNRKQTTVIDDEINLEFLTKEELIELINDIIEPSTVLHEDKPLKSELHPTMKPIPLIKRQIKYSTKKDGIVLDVFGGSGSTLIACEELDRTCYMCELDEKYCDVIIKRWESLTGRKAELIETGNFRT